MERMSILIIHKDDLVRRGIHNILSRFDFEIYYAANGLDGLNIAKHKKPNVIISQVALNVLNGFELGATIRKHPLLKEVPIIFLHENLDIDIINKAKLVKASAFLIHPYIDNSLIYATKRALGEGNLKISLSKSPASYESCRDRVVAGQRYRYA